ncbi:hypothetical protein M1615_02945 [Patescibacteria group bacterium]|nr:hypothetical protein [Patescibacteria group bacterium]
MKEIIEKQLTDSQLSDPIVDEVVPLAIREALTIYNSRANREIATAEKRAQICRCINCQKDAERTRELWYGELNKRR